MILAPILINYFGSPVTKGQLKWEDKESKNVSAAATLQNSSDPNGANAVGDAIFAKTIYCSGCNKLCENACYISIKVRMNYFCLCCYCISMKIIYILAVDSQLRGCLDVRLSLVI